MSHVLTRPLSPTRKVSDKQRRAMKIAFAYRAEIPTAGLAVALRFSSSTISRWFREKGTEIPLFLGHQIRREFIDQEQFPEYPLFNDAERERLTRYWTTLKDDPIRIHREEVLESYSASLSRRYLAAALEVSADTIGLWQRKLGIVVRKEVALRMHFALARLDVLPEFELFDDTERRAIEREHAKEKREITARLASKRKGSAKHGEKLFKQMCAERIRIWGPKGKPKRSVKPCKDCGEVWPRRAFFYHRQRRNRDGYVLRCKHCNWRENNAHRLRSKLETQPTPPGRVLRGNEERRYREVINLYGQEIPFTLLVKLFDASKAYSDRIRKEEKFRIDHTEARELMHEWRITHEIGDFELLTEDERSRLWQLWQELKSEYAIDQENRDQEHRDYLHNLAFVLRDKPNAPEPKTCWDCKVEWFNSSDFFRVKRRDKLDVRCKPCFNKRKRARQHRTFLLERAEKRLERAAKRRKPKRKNAPKKE